MRTGTTTMNPALGSPILRKSRARFAPQGTFEALRVRHVDRDTLFLIGELDLAVEQNFGRALAMGCERPTLIECSAVTFVDCAGLRVILRALRRGPRNQLANVPRHMARLIRMTGLDAVIEHHRRSAASMTALAPLTTDCEEGLAWT